MSNTGAVRLPWIRLEQGSRLEFDLPADEEGVRPTAAYVAYEDAEWVWALHYPPGTCPLGCKGICFLRGGEEQTQEEAEQEVLLVAEAFGYPVVQSK